MIKPDFDLASSYRIAPVTVFKPDFNNFAPLLLTKLGFFFYLFSGGRDDTILGSNLELGRLLNRILLSIVLAVALSSFVLRTF